MCTPASAFTVVALRGLPRPPPPPGPPDPPRYEPEPARRRMPGLLLAACLTWLAAGGDDRGA